MKFFRLFLIAAAALAAVVLFSACSDDERDNPGGGSPARVLVVDEANRVAVPGIKIVVMDPATNEPLAGPRLTDGDGLASFPELPVGRYPVLAYGGFRHRFSGFHPDLLHVVNPPRRTSGLTGPGLPGKTSFPEIGPLVYLAIPTIPDSLPRFSGQVVDAESGLPLEAAFIGLNPYLTGYQGDTGPMDDVTDAQGAFSVSQIPLAIDPDTGNVTQVQPLLVVRHGYRPASWRYRFPNGSQETDIKDVTIALEPAGDTDTGVLKGRIVRGGEPATGLPVGLVVISLFNKVGPGLTGHGAVTDGEGRFRIEGLPEGIFIVQPGYLLGDDAVFISTNGPEFRGYIVTPDKETDAGDLMVLHEVRPIQPYEGVLLGSQPDILIWTAVPGATEYEVRFDRAVLGRVAVSQFSIPEEMEMAPGRHTWEVGAFATPDSLIGYGQVPFQFRIEEPDK